MLVGANLPEGHPVRVAAITQHAKASLSPNPGLRARGQANLARMNLSPNEYAALELPSTPVAPPQPPSLLPEPLHTRGPNGISEQDINQAVNQFVKQFNVPNVKFHAPGGGGHFARSANAGGFLPKGVKFAYNRHDQGRDIQMRPGQAIIAPGAGYVVRWGSDPGGGGGHFGPHYPIVHFTSGPYAGRDVYIGHTVAALRPGRRFGPGMILAHTQHSGPLNGGAPDGWAEIGFAPGGTPGTFDQPAPF